MPDALIRVLEQYLGGRRLMLILVGTGALGVIWALAQWSMKPTMVPVAQGIPMEEVGTLAQRLDEEGIAYDLDRGGSSIVVADGDLAQARVILAQSGYPAGGQAGWELFDEPAWGMTDFTQRVNYRRALEGELERTISAMRGVESAQVHLAIQKTSVLRRDTPAAEASVVLALRSGSRPERAMVDGVASLVAGSVEGLDKEWVTVLDDTGRLLSSDDSDSDQEGLTTRQLAIQREVEGYLEDKAYELVEPVVGPGNITVRVAAALNFDELGRTVETFDLEQQTTLSEDRSEIIPGSEEQGASSVTVNTRYETPRSVETFNRSGAQLERLTVAVVVNERQVGEGDQATSQPRTQAELARVEALVRNALGISDARGDAITVVNLPFDLRPTIQTQVEEGTDVMGLVMAGIRPAVGLAALILAFVLSLRLMGSIKSVVPAVAGQGALTSGEGAAPAVYADNRPQAASGGGPTQAVSDTSGGQLQLSDPSITAKVVRAWMNDDGGQG